MTAIIPEPPPLPSPAFAPPATPSRPRVWPVFAVSLGAIIAGVAAASLALGIAAVVMVAGGTEPMDLEDAIGAFVETPEGILVAAIPSQAAFLLVVLTAASLSRQGMRARLGLGRGRIPVWGIPVLIVGALAVTFAWNVLLTLIFGDITGDLKEFTDTLGSASGVGAVAILLSLSIVPGIVEELLFRGYAQRRLVERWGPAVAIAISTVLFAAAHVDPRHAAGVLALGAWLGVISWRAGAVWPCMACHFANNLVGIGMMQLAGAEGVETQTTDTEMPWAWAIPIMAVGAAGVAGSIVLLVRAGRRPAPAG
jgi:uncharacterized protein